MCHGEYESMLALYAVSPEFIPRPIGFGTFESDPEQHFFLCEFIDLDDELPHVVDFCAKLADLHRRSSAMAPELKNPESKFGFHVITCNGTVPTHQIWEESWEAYYTDNIKHLVAWEEKLQGPSEKIRELLPTLYDKVIPRLLRPLETEGRILKPCLLHGDLWDGNTSVHAHTDAPYIFDASSFWGHNECDMAKMRGSRYRMRRMYMKEYTKHFPISPPEEDWDDRNLLYSLRADLHDSILFPATSRFRELLIVTLKQLTEKFADGYKGPAQQRGSVKPSHKEAPLLDQGSFTLSQGEQLPEVVPGLSSETWGGFHSTSVAPSADNLDKTGTTQAPFQSYGVQYNVGEVLGRAGFAEGNLDTKKAGVGVQHVEHVPALVESRGESRSDIEVGESAVSPPPGLAADA